MTGLGAFPSKNTRKTCMLNQVNGDVFCVSYFYNQFVVQALLFAIPYDVHPFWSIHAHHHLKKWKVSGFIDYFI